MLASLTTVLYIARSLLPAFASLFLLLTTVFLLQVHRPISLPLCPASFSVTNNSSYVALRVLSLSRVSLFSFASYSENCVLPTPAIIHVFPAPPDTGASPARPFLMSLSFPLLAAQATVHCPLTLLLRRGLCFPLQTTLATCELPTLSFTLSRAILFLY